MADNQRTSSLALTEAKELLRTHNKNQDNSAEIAARLNEALSLFPQSTRKEDDFNTIKNLLSNNRVKNILNKDQQQALQKSLRSLAGSSASQSEENTKQSSAASHQPNGNTKQPSAASHQPNGNTKQPSAASHQPNGNTKQPSAASHQPNGNDQQQPAAIDYTALKKDPKDLTVEDRVMLKIILNDPNTPADIRASARESIEAYLNSFVDEDIYPQPETKPQTQNQASDPTKEPQAENNELITEEERNKALQTLADSKYTPSPISKSAIKAALKSNEPETALANCDDMLAALIYIKKQNNPEDIAKITDISEARLKSLVPEMITPDNAESYRRLAELCGNEDLKKQALTAIADGLIKFDQENFGAFQPDVQNLSANYDYVLNKLKDTSPFDYPFDEKKDGVDISKIELTYDNGTPLSKKDEKETKDAVSALAREMTAQRLAKKKHKLTEEMLVAEYKKATLEIMANANMSMDKTGKMSVKNSTLGLTIANQFQEVDKFKNRLNQKFKDNKWVKKVTENVNKVDKKLEQRFGEPYRTSKKVLAFLGKTGYDIGKGLVKASPQIAKSALIMGAAGLVPGGPAIAMGYFMYKNVKSTVKKLQDPNATKGQKAFAVAQASVSAALSLVGMGTSLNAGAEVLKNMGCDTMGHLFTQGADTLNNIVGNIGHAASFGNVSKEAFTSALGSLTTYGRMAVIGSITALPNVCSATSMGFKQMLLKRKIKNEQDPEKLAQLIAKQKMLKTSQGKNLKELLCKTGGLVGGMLISQGVSSALSSTLHSDTVTQATENVKKAVTSNSWEDQDVTPTAETASQESHAEPQMESPRDKALSEMESPRDKALSEMEQQTQAQAPDELSGIKAHNLEAAKAENSSGVEGKSAYAHALQHLESLGDSRITDTNAMADNIAEHVGSKANLAVIACKMAPYALQDALHMDIPNNGNPTSYNMLQAIANNDLTPEQQTALNNFIEKNFDGTNIKMENFSAYNQVHTSTHTTTTMHHGPSHPELLQASADEAQRPVYRAPVDNSPAQSTVVIQQTVEPRPEPLHESVQVVYGSEAWAARSGLVYDPYLSQDLNTLGCANGSHGGYAAVFLDPSDPRHERAILLPNDPVHDKVEITTKTVLKEQMKQHCGPYGDGGYPEYASVRHLIGTGIVTYNPKMTNYAIDRAAQAHCVLDAVDHGTHVAKNVMSFVGFAKDVLGK